MFVIPWRLVLALVVQATIVKNRLIYYLQLVLYIIIIALMVSKVMTPFCYTVLCTVKSIM